MNALFTLRRLSGATLLSLAAGAQAAPAGPAAIAFDMVPRAGQHQRQTTDMQASMRTRMEAAPDATDEQRAKVEQAAQRMAQIGPMKMQLRMQQTMKVGAADASGLLPITVWVGDADGRLEIGGKAMPLPKGQPTGAQFTAKFNPKDFSYDMQQFDSGTAELNTMMNSQGKTLMSEALQLYKALAERPLQIGQSVEVPMTLSLPVPLPGGAGAMSSKVRYTLLRVERGVAHFKQDVQMDMNIDMDMPAPPTGTTPPAAAPDAASAAASAAPVAPMPPKETLRMRMSGQGTGAAALRLKDRLPLSNQLNLALTLNIAGPDKALMRMDMDMRMSAKGESLVGAPAPKKP